jgi:LuxR family maltose regulon positive regulatory protein
MSIDFAAWEGYRVIWLRLKAGPEWADYLQQTARSNAKKLALIELHAEHNEPQRFVTAVEKAVGAAMSQLGDLIQADYRAAWIALINRISELPDPLTLVLSGYDQIENEDVHEIVADLLEYQPESLQILLFCQTNPPLPLARLRVRRALLEVASG